MRRIRIRRARLGRGAAVSCFLALCGSVWAQGPPQILWQSADGAGTIAFSRDGRMLASAGSTSIFVRNASNGSLIRALHDKSGIGTVAISPNGQLVADGRTNGS